MLALTGTATPDVFDCVTKRLSLRDPVVIGLSPNRDNIKYHVEPMLAVHHLCDMFATHIRNSRTEFPKTLIFCQTIAECSLMYRTLRKLLGDDFTVPPGFPDFHKHRLVDMYTRASSDEMKKKILESFMRENGKLRLLIATSAFSMGVDCPDIRNVVHPGPTIFIGTIRTRIWQSWTRWKFICCLTIVWKCWEACTTVYEVILHKRNRMPT